MSRCFPFSKTTVAMTTNSRSGSYPSPTVYRAIVALRRQGRRVENYCRDRRLHAVDNAIVEEKALIAAAFPETDSSRF